MTLTNNSSTTIPHYDGMLIKYSESGEVEWAKAIGGSSSDHINSVLETSDGGYIVGGYFYSTEIDIGNGVTLTKNSNSTSSSDAIIIKYDKNGEIVCSKVIGGPQDEGINSISEIKNGDYIVGGYFEGSIDLENGETLTSNGSQDGMILKITEEMGAPEIQELTIENERKEYNITTDICEIDGIKGGTISGEDKSSYEKVKYGDNTTKEIVMVPDEGYEIIKITVNGEEIEFTENEDGSYKLQLTYITEDKHIEVTYSLKDNKIIINKVDSETKVGLEGATFKLDQIEEREVPESTIGTLTDNGQGYAEPNLEKEVTGVLGSLTDNGQAYNVTVDKTKEVTDVIGSLTNKGTYYFVEEDGKYVPTNSKTYRGSTGVNNSTANSYIESDCINSVSGRRRF